MILTPNDINLFTTGSYTDSGSGGRSGSFGDDSLNSGWDNFWQGLSKSLESMNTSALKAEKENTAAANEWAADQARINREFQQTSAERAMAFEADQANLNRVFQQTSADKAMAFEAEQAQKVMDYQERLANTQYQRAVADLKAAGLSPLLVYGNLNGTTPSGVSASGSAASGSMPSGRSAGGSLGSSYKENASSAKSADTKILSDFMNLVTSGFNSAASLIKVFA